MGHTSDDDLELTKIRCPPRSGLRNDLYNLPNLWHIMARKNGSKNMQNFNAEEILGSWMAFECGAGSSEKGVWYLLGLCLILIPAKNVLFFLYFNVYFRIFTIF